MELAINQLFQWREDGARIERILWIERTGHLITIDVTDKKAWPSLTDRSSFEQSIANGDIDLIDSDVYGHLHQQDDAFSLSYIEQRDRAWKIIEDIVASQEHGPDKGAIYDEAILGPLVQAAMKRTGCPKLLVCTCLRHYWQRGQMKNALLPEFDGCGSQGMESRLIDRQSPKRGRPSNVARQKGVTTGVNIDDTIKEYFRRGTKLSYENAEKMSRIGAFERILALFFQQGKELRNGVFVPLLPPADELPTFSQYQYWYRNVRDLARPVTAHEGSHAGQIRWRISGPGYLFEIHVVVANINCVNILDRRHILGRPVVYIIVDVFSDLIVGMNVSLEGPNRQGAMLALANMALDKGAFCREYGVEITEDAWPSHHLPKAILASKSELLLKNVDTLVNALDIEISNAQPCRLDWRESFERCFPLLDDTTIHWLPGSVNSPSEIGQKVHRLDGRLTLHEFSRLVIECIIEHNTTHRLSDDDLDGAMIADGVEPYPCDVWAWGIQNRTGALRLLPIDDVRRNLLLEAEASVTPEGICFQRQHYTCDRAIQEQWFAQVRTGEKGRLTIPILYDPRTADRIYLRLQENQPLEICWLLEKDGANFEDCDWFDIEDMIARHIMQRANATQNRQRRIKLQALQDCITEETQNKTSEALEDHAAQIEQKRKTDIQDVQEQAASGTEQPQPVFKGVVERFFALDHDKLFH